MDAFATASHRFIDITILVPVPPNLINRDDTGRPKTTTLGGVLRLAPSPQNFKLGLRRASTHGQNLIRSKWLPGIVVDQVKGRLASTDVPEGAEAAIYEAVRIALFDNSKKDAEKEKAAEKAAEKKAEKAAKKKAEAEAKGQTVKDVPVKEEGGESDPRKTNSLILVTQEEIDALASKLAPLLSASVLDKNAIKQAVKEAFVSCRKSSQSLHRSLYGRMVTNSEMDEHRDGALQIGFPFSAERARIQTDYFVATDDRNTAYAPPKEGQGTAHIGERPFAGGHTILVQGQIDLDQLATNARFDSLEDALRTHSAVLYDLVLDVVKTMVTRPFAAAAGQGNFRTSPRACVAMVRGSKTGCLHDMSMAFEVPVGPSFLDMGPSDVAADRLIKYADKMVTAYKEGDDRVILDITNGRSGDVDTFMADVLALIKRVTS